MAKVFKVFVNIILILFILVAAALFIPPLAGISTVVSGPDMVTNIQTGSVVYGRSTQIGQLSAGDEIVVTGDGSAYVYEIQEIDAETGTVTVAAGSGAGTTEITLRTTGQKVLLTVPFIGYVSIATQTMEGRIVLGLAVALLVVLFIVAEVWNRRNSDDEEDEDEEDEFYSELAEQKKRNDAEEERKFQTRKLAEQLREPEEGEEQPQISKEEAEMFIERLEPEETGQKEETMAAAAEKTADDVPDMQEALENALATEPMNSQGQTVQMPTILPEEKETPLQADEIVLAIPARSVEEILQEAYRDGEDPKVEKDELTGVTFVDFSDCL